MLYLPKKPKIGDILEICYFTPDGITHIDSYYISFYRESDKDEECLISIYCDEMEDELQIRKDDIGWHLNITKDYPMIYYFNFKEKKEDKMYNPREFKEGDIVRLKGTNEYRIIERFVFGTNSLSLKGVEGTYSKERFELIIPLDYKFKEGIERINEKECAELWKNEIEKTINDNIEYNKKTLDIINKLYNILTKE